MKKAQQEGGNSPEIELHGGITLAQIQKWKKQYGAVSLITTLDDNGEELFFWFKKPTMDTMSAVNKILKNDEVKAAVIFFQNCLINQENVSYKGDAIVMQSIMPLMQEIVKQRTATIKKF